MKNYDKKKILLVSESDSFNLGDKLISELVFRESKRKELVSLAINGINEVLEQ